MAQYAGGITLVDTAMPFRLEIRPITWAGAWQAVVVAATLFVGGAALMAGAHSYTLQVLGWVLGYCSLLLGLLVFLFAMLLLRRREKLEAPPLSRERGGYQDWPIEGSEAVGRMGKQAEQIAAVWSRFNQRMNYHVAQEIATRGKAYAHRRAGAAAGRDLAKLAAAIDRRIAAIESDADIVVECYVGLAEWAQPATPADVEAIRIFITQIGGMASGCRAAATSMEGYKTIARSKRDINRVLNSAITNIAATMDRGISTFRKVESAIAQAIAILSARIGAPSS